MNFSRIYFSTSIALLIGTAAARAQTAEDSTLQLAPFEVSSELDKARELIVPQLGATSYLMDAAQIQNLAQGENAPFNQLLLRAPGVAQDSAVNGDLHVRGEHANLQYRINDVLLPEGISGFGLELDSHFVDTMQLVTGSLPAQYGFRTAGIVDIHTKSGYAGENGEATLYAGSFDTVRPSLETSGGNGKLSYFANLSYEHNDLGIENPTPSVSAIHDHSDQTKAFVYVSDLLDRSSRLSVLVGVSVSRYEVPNTPNLPPGLSPGGEPWLPDENFDSRNLNENQHEQNGYLVAAYQKSSDTLNFQLSGFARQSRVDFNPDPIGDLYFNGVASQLGRRLNSIGVEGDGSDAVGSNHTVRGGFTVFNESVREDAMTTVFALDEVGNPNGGPFAIADNGKLRGLFAGAYLQDEWKLTSRLTINYGARFDVFRSSFDDELQLSPRVNLVDELSSSTTLHAGYARYFTPPPVENVPKNTVAQFNGTSNASAVTLDDPVRAERANYFDVGISQKITDGFRVGLDGYYKRARDQLDDGLFGQTLILSAFNYARGEIYGLEETASYTKGGFAVYLNLAQAKAQGEDWISSQFLFDPNDLAYVKNHWIALDHDQKLTGSGGISYQLKEAFGSTRFLVDALYGSGLRADATAPDGTSIPNGAKVPSDFTVNIGVEQSFKFAAKRLLSVRVDVVNVTDRIYELRDGSGVGVNAAQYGMRRGFFGTLAYQF
ncbi:MAG TPA: TonB-dependent receptor [Opitutaceae bacterium]